MSGRTDHIKREPNEASHSHTIIQQLETLSCGESKIFCVEFDCLLAQLHRSWIYVRWVEKQQGCVDSCLELAIRGSTEFSGRTGTTHNLERLENPGLDTWVECGPIAIHVHGTRRPCLGWVLTGKFLSCRAHMT